MAGITLHQVTKSFSGDATAVRELDLTIRDGEIFILVGPSGCGKSTILNMIVGLEQPSEGEIRVNGRPVTNLDPKDRNMAMVFQSYALYPHMTVRENMAFPLRMAGVERARIREKVERAASILELGGVLDRRPGELSGGQRQRVAMGRAIVREPVAFLLDEPLSNLDAKLRAQMRTEIVRLQRRLGTTMVYVTHDQAEAMTLGDHIAVLRGGSLQQVGTPRELYAEPKNLFVAGFIGSPPMNFLPAVVEEEILRLPMGALLLPQGLRNRPDLKPGDLIAGIRPEDLGVVKVEPEEAGADLGPTFRAEVELVEWMGADVYLYLEVEAASAPQMASASEKLRGLLQDLGLSDSGDGKRRLSARVPGGGSPVVEGESLYLGVDPDRLLFFHPETGERVA
jgi:multiple sugar transport system ATP-binding protein